MHLHCHKVREAGDLLGQANDVKTAICNFRGPAERILYSDFVGRPTKGGGRNEIGW